ncbi:MAG: hypothetical protein LBQ39_01985 [Tannerellaceae bacterium]|jgi:hypothetical protein|nr:hypothetical protein [Tannerellaceae bacterium]
MATCEELNLEVVRIDAYPQEAITLPVGYTQKRTVPASALTLSGQPLSLSLREQTGNVKSVRSEDAAGPLFTNTIQWQADDTSATTLAQIHALETADYHFIVYTYGGKRRLIYNEDANGRTHADINTSDEETANLSYTIHSRLPVLLVESGEWRVES